MKYKLLKDIPWIMAWEILDVLEDVHPYPFKDKKVSSLLAKRHPDFFEPIIEKKRYEDLKRNDMIFEIEYDWTVYKSHFELDNCRSETFLTREEAGDEHKRREWAVRADKFIPKEWEQYFVPWKKGVEAWDMTNSFIDIVFINSWLAFRTREECEQAIKEHDLIRLFYSIR